MPNEAFSRTIINSRERPVSSDINQLQSSIDRTVREILRGLFIPHALDMTSANTGFTPLSGFMGDGFYVAAGGGMQVNVQAGLGFIYDAAILSGNTNIDGVSQLDDRSAYYPVYLSANQPLTVPAAPAGGQERYDIIEVKLDRRRQDTASRDVLNITTGIFEPTNVLKTFAYLLDGRTGQVSDPAANTTGIGYKVGTSAAAGAGVIPATSPGYVRVAVIKVDGGVVSIAQNKLVDDRILIAPNGMLTAGLQITQIPGTPDLVLLSSGCPSHAGMRFGVRSLSSPGGSVRIYVFGGKMSNLVVVPNVQMPGITTANANRVPLVTSVSTGTVDATVQAALASQMAVAVGQPYAYFDVANRTVDPGDPVDSTIMYNVHLMIGMR